MASRQDRQYENNIGRSVLAAIRVTDIDNSLEVSACSQLTLYS